MTQSMRGLLRQRVLRGSHWSVAPSLGGLRGPLVKARLRAWAGEVPARAVLVSSALARAAVRSSVATGKVVSRLVPGGTGECCWPELQRSRALPLRARRLLFCGGAKRHVRTPVGFCQYFGRPR